MKRIHTVALAAALGIGFASLALYAQINTEESLPAGPPPGGPRFGPPKAILEKYDANKDGTLDETERAALRQDIEDGKIQPPPPGRGPRGHGGPRVGPPKELVQKYDANQDGKLDETERAAMRKDVEDGKLEPPPIGEGGPRLGPPTATAILEKFDIDKDGKLDEAELTAFLKSHRPPPGPRGPLPPPRPGAGVPLEQ